MLANYGYKDGAGDFFITIDTDKCDGCGKCVPACPVRAFVVGEDENDPLRETPVVAVAREQRKQLKYACSACKPSGLRPPLPCVAACPFDALKHSW